MKNRFKTDFFKLSVLLEELEILATGGFWGEIDGSDKKIVPSWNLLSFTCQKLLLVCSILSQAILFLCCENICRCHLLLRTDWSISILKTNQWKHAPTIAIVSIIMVFFPENPSNLIPKSAYHQASSLLLRLYTEKRYDSRGDEWGNCKNKASTRRKKQDAKTILDR